MDRTKRGHQTKSQRNVSQAETTGKCGLSKNALEGEWHQKEQAEQNDVGQQADQISACEGPFLEQQQRNKRIGSATFPDDERGQQNGAGNCTADHSRGS